MFYKGIVSFFILAPSLSACLSISTLHTAKPVEAGELEVTLSRGLYIIAADPAGTLMPQVEGQIRYGVSDNIDIGFKSSNLLANTFDFNWAVLNIDSLVLSFDPSISVQFVPTEQEMLFLVYGWFSILMDVLSSNDFRLTVGIRPGAFVATDNLRQMGLGQGSNTGFLLGGSVGAKIRLGESVALQPELSAATIVGKPGKEILLNAGIGLVF